jgi:hypothetical protein
VVLERFTGRLQMDPARATVFVDKVFGDKMFSDKIISSFL